MAGEIGRLIASSSARNTTRASPRICEMAGRLIHDIRRACSAFRRYPHLIGSGRIRSFAMPARVVTLLFGLWRTLFIWPASGAGACRWYDQDFTALAVTVGVPGGGTRKGRCRHRAGELTAVADPLLLRPVPARPGGAARLPSFRSRNVNTGGLISTGTAFDYLLSTATVGDRGTTKAFRRDHPIEHGAGGRRP